jgi:hypothetical protein
VCHILFGQNNRLSFEKKQILMQEARVWSSSCSARALPLDPLLQRPRCEDLKSCMHKCMRRMARGLTLQSDDCGCLLTHSWQSVHPGTKHPFFSVCESMTAAASNIHRQPIVAMSCEYLRNTKVFWFKQPKKHGSCQQ